MIPDVLIEILFGGLLILVGTILLGLATARSRRLDNTLDRLEAENYILRESLRYLRDRSERPGWIDEWGPIVATNALEIINDPEKLKYYTELCK